MFMNSSNLLFMSMTIMGVMVSFSSSSWLMIWIGMEISMMSFIPLISIKSFLNSEFSMKYFIIQSISSMIILFSLIMMLMKIENFNTIMLCSLIMKMGGVPFHNWVVSTVDGLSYESLFILLIIMKIGPLLMISYMNTSLMMFIILCLIFGSINGLNQSSLKKMLTFSSIYNLSLILFSLKNNSIWILMMMNYSIIMMGIIITMKKFKINYINQMIFIEMKNYKKLVLMISMMSLGGMPPLLGFQMKMMIFEMMIQSTNYILSFILILSSLLIFYFYMNMMVSMLMFSSISLKLNMSNKMLVKNWFIILMLNSVLFWPFMMTKLMT
uniref:NADH dehydrogenase subunit 2 n=1 Tax=Krisna furcata TaxID=1962556 RepID=UPI002551F748|nr:NADH dehydrogenase subunit 2 [Krisna furcata]WGG89420.1 NADH dehydrogenase subunit 2 [Krisna furcata]